MERNQNMQVSVPETLLNRKDIAVRLRQNGIDVDYEDWDGLSDEVVINRIANITLIDGLDFEKIIPEHEMEPFMEWPHEV